MFGKYTVTLGLGVAAALGGWFGGAASAAPAPHVTRPAVFTRTSASEPPQLGAAVNDVMLAKAGPRYVATLLAHYRSITPEWEMEMSQLEPARGRFIFARADVRANPAACGAGAAEAALPHPPRTVAAARTRPSARKYLPNI